MFGHASVELVFQMVQRANKPTFRQYLSIDLVAGHQTCTWIRFRRRRSIRRTARFWRGLAVVPSSTIARLSRDGDEANAASLSLFSCSLGRFYAYFHQIHNRKIRCDQVAKSPKKVHLLSLYYQNIKKQRFLFGIQQL